MITPADVKARFPEFANLEDSYIQLYIDEAVLQLNESRWGRYYDLGLLYLTAHLIAMAQSTFDGPPTGLGMVSSESVGDVSVSYAVPTGFDQDMFYMSTAYGRRFIELGRVPGVGGIIV